MEKVGGFEPTVHIAVAVSGGCDSMALCLLTQEWAAVGGGKVTALIVDHGLRPESGEEADYVASVLQQHAIESVVFTLGSVIGCSSVQSEARKRRYNEMLRWCKENGVLHLLVAHHANDQQETVLMRLVRGSGLHGLTAMSMVGYRQEVRIIRPLLEVTKEECKAFLESLGQAWVEDPSNAKSDYARNRLRHNISFLQSEGWSVERSIRLVDNLRRSEAFVQRNMVQWMVQHVMLHAAGVVSFSKVQFDTLDEELRLRVITHCLSCINSDDSLPRFNDVEALNAALMCADGFSARTLNGCYVLVDNFANNIIFCRELSRMALEEVLENDVVTVWDNSYHVKICGDGGDVCKVAPLGVHGVTVLRKQKVRLPRLPVEVLRVFPAIWLGEGVDCVVAVPHMDYYADEMWRDRVEIVWLPVRMLAG